MAQLLCLSLLPPSPGPVYATRTFMERKVWSRCTSSHTKLSPSVFVFLRVCFSAEGQTCQISLKIKNMIYTKKNKNTVYASCVSVCCGINLTLSIILNRSYNQPKPARSQISHFLVTTVFFLNAGAQLNWSKCICSVFFPSLTNTVINIFID